MRSAPERLCEPATPLIRGQHSKHDDLLHRLIANHSTHLQPISSRKEHFLSGELEGQAMSLECSRILLNLDQAASIHGVHNTACSSRTRAQLQQPKRCVVIIGKNVANNESAVKVKTMTAFWFDAVPAIRLRFSIQTHICTNINRHGQVNRPRRKADAVIARLETDTHGNRLFTGASLPFDPRWYVQ